MGSDRKFNISASQLAAYITLPKLIQENIEFQHYPRNSKKSPHGFHEWQSTYIVSLQKRQQIDNLFVTLKSQIMADFWYHSFRLHLRHEGQVNNIYQLEVYPEWINSHTEPDGIKFYGTHTHTIDQTEKITFADSDRFSWYEWLNYFAVNIQLTIQGTITAPNEGELGI